MQKSSLFSSFCYFWGIKELLRQPLCYQAVPFRYAVFHCTNPHYFYFLIRSKQHVILVNRMVWYVRILLYLTIFIGVLVPKDEIESNVPNLHVTQNPSDIESLLTSLFSCRGWMAVCIPRVPSWQISGQLRCHYLPIFEYQPIAVC